MIEIITRPRTTASATITRSTRPQLVEAITDEIPKVTLQLNVLIAVEQRLRALEKERDREPEKRWQADV